MINDKNIRSINKHIKHMKSMDNAIRFEELSIQKTGNKPSFKHMWKLYFQLWKDRSKRKIIRLHVTQEGSSSDRSIDHG